ncbi:DUF6712 family protein [Flavobacterium hauense]
MKLLFAKSGTNGSTELKALLGFIDADIKFEKIKSDVTSATKEVVKLMGKEVYDKVIDIYTDSSTDEDELDLLYNTRYPIAIRAYMLLAPSNDIAHTSNGRKMRSDTNEKQAFEWMLDRDNENLERRYYRALDDLIEYLDENVEEWKESDAYKKSHSLFIRTTDEFNDFFRIESRLMLLKLEPGIRQCEQNEILPRLGTDKFEELKGKVKDGSDLSADEKKLLNLVKEACVYYSLSWAMMRLSVQLFPEGVLQAYTSDRMTTKGKLPSVNIEPEAARLAFASDASVVVKKIEDLLSPPAEQETDEPLDPDFISGDNFIST